MNRVLLLLLLSTVWACEGRVLDPGASSNSPPGPGPGPGPGTDAGTPGDPMIEQPDCYESRNDEVRWALAGACAGCHTMGNRPFFASLAAFENGLLYDRRYVVPGDPDGSVLIALLEGRGTGTYTQMPPGMSYAMAYAEGKAKISLTELKAFIRELPATPPTPAAPLPEAFTVRRLSAEEMVLSLMGQLGLELADFVDTSSPNWREQELTFRGGRLGVWPVDWAPGISHQYVSDDASGERFLALGGPQTLEFRGPDRTLSPSAVQTLVQVSQAWCSQAIDKQGNRAVLRHVTLNDKSDTKAAEIRANIAALYLRMLGDPAPAEDVEAIYQRLYLPYEATSTKAAWTAVCASFVRHPKWLTY